MQIRGIKVGLVIIVMFFVLGSLFFVQYMWESNGIYKPLLKSLKKIEGVNEASIERKRKDLQINLELGHVDNFPLTYKQVEDSINQSLSKTNYKIKIKDNRNDQLISSFLSFSSYVQEGIQTGKYSLMEEQIKSRAKAQGLDGSYVLVDSQNIYLQLLSKDSYLYEVISRK